MKKALLYLGGGGMLGLYWFAWDSILPAMAKEILKGPNPALEAQFWLILTFPLWVAVLVALFLWILRMLDK